MGQIHVKVSKRQQMRIDADTRWKLSEREGQRKGSSSADSVHGSLLVMGELLRHTGEFMLARYREVVEMVLQYRDSREKIIRSSVVTLLPRIASFALGDGPRGFSLLASFMISSGRNPSSRAVSSTGLPGS